MIDLSRDINPFFTQKKVVRYLKKNIKRIHNYPDKNLLFSGIEIDKSINDTNVIVTNGTLCAMNLLLKAYGKRKIGMFNPTFWGIKKISEINNYDIIEKKIGINDNYDISDIEKLAKKVDVLYLCNHNNPTLNYIPPNKLVSIIKNNKNCKFIVDETVLCFSKNYKDMTIAKYVNHCENLSVIISLSKIFGIAGLRAGLLIVHKSIKDNVLDIQIPYSINALAQIYIMKYLNCVFESRKLDSCKQKINKNFIYLAEKVDKTVVKKIIYKNSAFLLMEISEKIDYYSFIDYLLKNGVKISATNKYYNVNNNYIKVGAGKKKQYKTLIKTIKKYRREI